MTIFTSTPVVLHKQLNVKISRRLLAVELPLDGISAQEGKAVWATGPVLGPGTSGCSTKFEQMLDAVAWVPESQATFCRRDFGQTDHCQRIKAFAW